MKKLSRRHAGLFSFLPFLPLLDLNKVLAT